MTQNELEVIANKLTNEDLVSLVELVANRLVVFVEDNSTLYELNEDSPSCINGSAVQINTQ